MSPSACRPWHAEEVLDLLSDRLGSSTCPGLASSTGQRCRNPIGKQRRASASDIISKLPKKLPKAAEIQEQLAHLARVTLCHCHPYQVGDVVRIWSDAIEDETRRKSAAKTARKTFGPERHEMDDLWSTIRNLQAEIERLEHARCKLNRRASDTGRTSKSSSRRTSSTRDSASSRTSPSNYSSDNCSVFTEDTEYSESDETSFSAAEALRQQEEEEIKKRAAIKARRAQSQAAAKKAAAEKAAAEKAAAEEQRRVEARRQADRERAEQIAERKLQAARETKRRLAEAAAKARRDVERQEWHDSWERYEHAWDNVQLRVSRGDPRLTSGKILNELPWPTKSGLAQDVLGPSVREFFERGGQCLGENGVTTNKALLIRLRKVELFRWHADKIAHKFSGAEDIEHVQKLAKVVTQTIYGLMDGLKS